MSEGDPRAQRPCPECGKPARGNFCQHCGAALGGRFCNQCGWELAAGGRFCNQCGAAVGAGAGAAGAAEAGGAEKGAERPKRGGASRTDPPPQHDDRRAAAASMVGGSNLPWWIVGVAMFGLILAVGWSMVRPGQPAAPAGAGGAPAGNPAAGQGTTDITDMSPREAADRLFNRIMQAAASGDSLGAQQFMPMALQAYERARPLDSDGLYHLSLLQRTGFDAEGALATAQEILAEEPNHLLGLQAAAEAALELGRTDEAAAYYRRIVDSYDAEVARELPEYLGHARIIEPLRAEAEAFLAGR